MEKDYSSLTDEQIVELAQSNDALAMETIVARYKNYVKKVIRPYFIIGADYEDLLQEGMIGVFKAVQTFNGKASFSSYAYLCIKSSVYSAIKKSQREKNKPLNNYVSLCGDADNDVDKNEFIVSTADDPETSYIDKESEGEFLKSIRGELSDMEYNILTLFLQGYSYKEIGNKYSKSEKSIDNALQRVRRKINKG